MSDSESTDSIASHFSDNTDEDETYVPNAEDQNISSHSSQSENSENETENEEPQPKRPKHPGKKKTRRPHLWKQNLRALDRNEGRLYTDRKGKVHEAKKMEVYDHDCRFKCNKNLSEEQRQTIFEEYWKLGNWELQSSFLNSSVVLSQPKRKSVDTNNPKSISCQFMLAGQRVCKSMFLKTLAISNKRISNVIIKKRTSKTAITPRDMRGKKPSARKTPEAVKNLVLEHISKFPKYSSHYSRVQAPNKKYLSPNLNIKKMYQLYREFIQNRDENLQPVTEPFYRHVFNTNFNLSFKKPQTDTCNVCDRLKNVIDHGAPGEKQSASIQKELHLRKAENAKSAMSKAKEESKHDPTHVSICFDLQKMLPTPVLTCSRVYYSRQLWTYNLCVHNMADDNANMFIWHEGQASRGCEEIMSCLLKFINTLPSTVTHLTAFSDNCGGQNKSQFIVKFWMYVIKNTNIQTVDHKFLQCGHSYNDCDRDFGTVERAMRRHDKGIFVPDDWAEIIAKSSKKFLVIRMNNDDFICIDEIQRFFVKSVVGIRKMQWLQYRRSEPWTLFYKDTFNEDLPFSTYSMKAKQIVGRLPETLPRLTAKKDRKKIKLAKKKDLLNLLEFIPPIHHAFYRTLATEGNVLTSRANTRLQSNNDVATTESSAMEAEVDDEEADNIYDSDYTN